MTLRQPLTPEKALVRAEELCAKAERSSGEIKKKLHQWGILPADAARIIDSLVDRRFIDDRRFCRAYVRDKVKFARWGRRKIALGLYENGIARDLRSEALADIDPHEYLDNLRHLLQLKRRCLNESDSFQLRTKLFRFAASRGYEPDEIKACL